ncbi:Hsp20 family protein [Oricola cellulosilytica]|uniref:Hsp20 family protein n=1 Tax=Oricola cellulosilytica TaxID=1429082 RepID=A0A4R0PIF2_9HYPH|nr:Hsp20 family protein [Oricola cellulosilytica]TCD16290.1 Hsp20 family protein [Oricola cellulosilytica]
MTRVPPFSSPLLVGFETIEKSLERIAKTADGYPPYNVEKLQRGDVEVLRITLAVAGFSIDDLEISTEDGQLLIRGRQADDSPREFLHRGIASRQFQKAFVLADGMRVLGAELKNGLLAVDLDRPKSEKMTRKIAITENS